MAQGLDFSRLDGTTKAKDRIQIVKEFNRSTHINLCLVSTMLVEENKNTEKSSCSIIITFSVCVLYKDFFFSQQGRRTRSELCGGQCSGAF